MDEPREYPAYIVPHSDLGAPDCCGRFFPVEKDGVAVLKCNECGFVLKTIPAEYLQQTLDRLQLTLDVASEQCPECGNVNISGVLTDEGVHLPSMWGNGESVTLKVVFDADDAPEAFTTILPEFMLILQMVDGLKANIRATTESWPLLSHYWRRRLRHARRRSRTRRGLNYEDRELENGVVRAVR